MTMSKNDFTTDEERAFDVVLQEAMSGTRPPDLSCEILARLYNPPVETENVTRPARQRRQARGKRKRTMQIAVAIFAVGSLAAMFAAIVSLQPDRDLSDGMSTLADNSNTDTITGTETTNSGDATTKKSKERQVKGTNSKRKPLRGVQMMVQTPKSEETKVDVNESGGGRIQESVDLAELSLVSAQIDAEMQGYWDAVGIQPTTEAASEETAARLSAILGTEVPTQAVANAEELQAELAQSVNAEAVAKRWLELITDRGSDRIDAGLRENLVQELATCFQTGSSFDTTLAGWLSGKSKNSSAFYAALSSGPRSASGEHGMARRLASLTMSVDLRCTRCHDAYIAGNGLQNDYWSFSAFLKRGVERDADGNFKIDTASSTAKQVFYELSDGRQRVANPILPSSWMKSPGDDGYKQIKQWSEGLLGSSELARGVVNSLWQLVHGQPLHGRVVDPITAPHNEALRRLEEQLTQDLIDSRFNVSRTLALVIASPATRRAVPESLLPENVWASNQAETKAAMHAVDAFAAVLPARVALPAAQRADQVMRSIGAKIDMTGKESLGQFGENSKSVKGRKNGNSLSADFPAKAEALPVQWLKLLDDLNNQIEHLGYLAGQNEVPPHVVELIEAMNEAEVDSNLLLHRVWWLMKP